ncbi:MAG: 8-oxo-dGTP pyrophosphatase MutT (NUDIX family) [Patescibacteria group bacterium]|jgi:8-oxo-dGTP pyrophosphatase MutT (NUDIX family)
MYKIYINEKPLLLMNTIELEEIPKDITIHLQSRYTGKTKFLLQHIDLLEKTTKEGAVIIYASDFDALWSDFKSLYRIITAAGGLVYNPDGEVLAIHRIGFWDLPKGKIEKGEKKKMAAVREVMEETGLKKVKLEHKLITTYHTYRHPRKDNRVLKKTFWYRMSSADEGLTPQAEEGIEKAIWVRPANLKEESPIYLNILDVLKA